MPQTSHHEKELYRVFVLGTALSFGVLGAIMVSMKDFASGNGSFEFSYKTVLAFLVGAAAGVAFWSLVKKLARKGDAKKDS